MPRHSSSDPIDDHDPCTEEEYKNNRFTTYEACKEAFEIEQREQAEQRRLKRVQLAATLIPKQTAGAATHTYNGRTYKVHTGKRGGRYIMVKGKARYI
jgi:oxalate decarboxylase/phosphoglucose isomerase-like protein (cupin superfamily)